MRRVLKGPSTGPGLKRAAYSCFDAAGIPPVYSAVTPTRLRIAE
jgi:hypothetical protein